MFSKNKMTSIFGQVPRCENSFVLFFFGNNKKFCAIAVGLLKTVTVQEVTGSGAEPQLPEAREVWHYGDIYKIFPIKTMKFWHSAEK